MKRSRLMTRIYRQQKYDIGFFLGVLNTFGSLAWNMRAIFAGFFPNEQHEIETTQHKNYKNKLKDFCRFPYECHMNACDQFTAVRFFC